MLPRGSEVNGLDSQKGKFLTNHYYKASDWFLTRSVVLWEKTGAAARSPTDPGGLSATDAPGVVRTGPWWSWPRLPSDLHKQGFLWTLLQNTEQQQPFPKAPQCQV